MTFCSRASLEAVEVVAGTAPRGRAYLFLPVAKRFWGVREMNRSWAEPQELEAIAAARRDGIVTRLYNPPRDGGEGAPMIVYGPSDVPPPETLSDLLGLFGTRWSIDPDQRPRLAICTHGTRDRCCAKWGFAAYGRARALFDEGRSPFEPLECSHLGGDRFAATGVVFPSGSMYAHLDRVALDSLADAEAAGHILPEFYRGRVFDPALAQVVRAGLAAEGHYNNATAALSIERPDPEGLGLNVATGTLQFHVTTSVEEVRFFASCENLAKAKRASGRRTVYVSASLI